MENGWTLIEVDEMDAIHRGKTTSVTQIQNESRYMFFDSTEARHIYLDSHT